VYLKTARNLISADWNGLSDPYCILCLEKQTNRSSIKPETLNPTVSKIKTNSVKSLLIAHRLPISFCLSFRVSSGMNISHFGWIRQSMNQNRHCL
jgi:hypothetical protein